MVTDDAPASRWWHDTVIYQVYPRSFQDSDGDGIGDLRGVISRLDYLRALGVGTIWLSPFFASPQGDFGYDVADYDAVAPEYGDLATLRELLDEAHARGLRVVLDLVLNHTSAEHPWFVESRASRANPKADWYLWHDGRRGAFTWLTGKRRRPNNWRATLDLTTAWQWDAGRGQFYLASFLPFQPDLNWRNPGVREEMLAVARRWLEFGSDGFRLDVFGWIMKDPEFRSNPFRPSIGGGDIVRLWRRDFTENTPDAVTLAKELRAVCAEAEAAGGPGGRAGERILIGEVFGDPEVVGRYLGDDDGLTLTFAFDFLAYRYSARYFRRLVAEQETHFAWPRLPAYVLENHDRSRTINRVGGDERKARLLAVVLLTLRGVPTIYQGQELGLANTYLPLRAAKDPLARTFFPRLPEWISRRMAERINRDEVRTPVPWDASAHAGFTAADATPWLPLGANAARHAERQADDPASMLSFYRELLRLRAELPALRRGTLTLLDAGRGVLAYRRDAEGEASVVVVANLGRKAVTWQRAHATVALASDSTFAQGQAAGSGVVVPAHAAVVLTRAPPAAADGLKRPS